MVCVFLSSQGLDLSGSDVPSTIRATGSPNVCRISSRLKGVSSTVVEKMVLSGAGEMGIWVQGSRDAPPVPKGGKEGNFSATPSLPRSGCREDAGIEGLRGGHLRKRVGILRGESRQPGRRDGETRLVVLLITGPDDRDNLSP